MEKEEQIISMLQSIMETLGSHDKRFFGIEQRLDGMDQRFTGIEQRLDNQEATLKEHGQILTALRSGQEHLKAEIEGMKVSNAKEFGSCKEELNNHSAKIEVLKDDTWENKVDIHRMKNTMGMS